MANGNGQMDTYLDLANDILAELTSRGFKEEADGWLRGNRPDRPGADSKSFRVRKNKDGFLGWIDHVKNETGGMKALAEMLNVAWPPAGGWVENTKRPYLGLEDYARSHFPPELAATAKDSFKKFGWREVVTHQDRPALPFATASGMYYRFIDGESPSFKPEETGYERCWYGLTWAVNMLKEKPEWPLVIVNGPPSVVAAQALGIPACCLTAGEKAIPPAQLEQLKHLWKGAICYVPDCDETGLRAASALKLQLPGLIVVDLGLTSKADLGDFCVLWGQEAPNKLLTLIAVLAQTDGYRTMAQVRIASQNQARAWRKDPRLVRGLATGFPQVDQALGGILNDDIVVIMALSGVGKTQFVTQLAMALGEQERGIVFSTEINPQNILHRMVSIKTGLRVSQIDTGIYPDEYDLNTVYESLDKYQIDFFARSNPTPEQVQRYAEICYQAGGRWVILDSLNNVNSGANGEIYSQIQQTMRTAMDLRDLGMRVILTVQYNAGQHEDGKLPNPFKAYGGQKAYQDSSKFWILHRPAYMDETGLSTAEEGVTPDRHTYLHVAKDRRDGKVGLRFRFSWTGVSLKDDPAEEGEPLPASKAAPARSPAARPTVNLPPKTKTNAARSGVELGQPPEKDEEPEQPDITKGKLPMPGNMEFNGIYVHTLLRMMDWPLDRCDVAKAVFEGREPPTALSPGELFEIDATMFGEEKEEWRSKAPPQVIAAIPEELPEGYEIWHHTEYLKPKPSTATGT